MKRRQLLKSIAAAPVLARAQRPEFPRVETKVADAEATPVVRYFTPSQFAALRKLCDQILPAIRETPSAVDAKVPEFLDFLISQSPSPRQVLYRTGLDRLSADKDFDLSSLHQPWSYEGPSDPYARFLIEAKHDILAATASSLEWWQAVSKRNPAATGLGTYWRAVD